MAEGKCIKGKSVVLVLFHATLVMLLISILASATCFSAYLVSRKKLLLFAFFAFLFYFFDVAFIFQDEFVTYVAGSRQDLAYLAARSLLNVITGGGFLVAFWLLVCDYLGQTKRLWLVGPGVLFVVGSLGMLIVVPDSATQRFLFYFMRELFGYWILLYTAFRYLFSHDEVERNRLWKHRWLFVIALVLNTAVLGEDIALLLVLNETVVSVGPLVFSPERNYAEELLMVVIMYVASRDALRILALRFERPIACDDERLNREIADNLFLYARRHQLTERECEVLRLVLMGKDNQNIASSMQLALSTVKVHVHNILQKTSCTNRQNLSQDFWKTS